MTGLSPLPITRCVCPLPTERLCLCRCSYVVLRRCPQLAAYIRQLFVESDGIPALCYSLRPSTAMVDGVVETKLAPPPISVDPIKQASTFAAAAERHLAAFIDKQRHIHPPEAILDCDTWVIPCLQMAPHSVRQDETFCHEMIQQLGSSGNVPCDLPHAIINQNPANI